MSGGLRFAPAPPNVSCVICCANNLYPSGPSPYTCPGVDKPPDITYTYKKRIKNYSCRKRMTMRRTQSATCFWESVAFSRISARFLYLVISRMSASSAKM